MGDTATPDPVTTMSDALAASNPALAAMTAAPQPQPIDTSNGPAPDSDPQMLEAPQMPAGMPQPAMEPQPTHESHMDVLGNIMGKVSSLMAGDEKWVVTRDPEGNTTAEKIPMHQGEKWGRIAAAALGGAARGLAAGQGPGGAARAVGAGAAFGEQIPQKQEDAANAEADTANRRLTEQGRRALLNQQVTSGAITLKNLAFKAAQEETTAFNDFSKRIADAPGSSDGGIFKDPREVYNLHKTHPELFKAHPQGQVITTPEIDAGGNYLGMHAYIVDRGYNERKNETALPWYTMQRDPKDPMKMTLVQTDTIDPGTMTNKDYDDAMMGLATRVQTYRLGQANIDEKAAQVPKLAADTKKAEADAKLATEKAEHPERFRNPTNVNLPGVAVPGGGAGGGQADALIAPGGPFSPGTVNGSEAEKLARGDSTLQDIKGRGGKGQPTPAQWDAAANAVSMRDYGLPYSTEQVKQERDFYNDKTNTRILDSIDKMIGVDGGSGYLQKLTNLAEKTGLSSNAPINEIRNAIKTRYGDDAVTDFNTVLGDTRSLLPKLIGMPGGSDNKLKIEMANELLAKHPTISNIKSQVAIITDMLQSSKDSMARNNRYIQQRYSQRRPDYGAPAGTGTVTPAPSASTNTSQAAVQQTTPAKLQVEGEPQFKAAETQPTNPPGPNKVFGNGSKGLGWYPIKKGS